MYIVFHLWPSEAELTSRETDVWTDGVEMIPMSPPADATKNLYCTGCKIN